MILNFPRLEKKGKGEMKKHQRVGSGGEGEKGVGRGITVRRSCDHGNMKKAWFDEELFIMIQSWFLVLLTRKFRYTE